MQRGSRQGQSADEQRRHGRRAQPFRGAEQLQQPDRRERADRELREYSHDDERPVGIGRRQTNEINRTRIRREILGLGGDFRFQADPIGAGRTPFSERIHIVPGDTVEVVIYP